MTVDFQSLPSIPCKVSLVWENIGAVTILPKQLENLKSFSAQELCESRGGRPGLSVPNSP